MKLTVNFNLISSNVRLLLSILKNKSVSEDAKKVIFKVTKDGLAMHSFSTTVIAQVKLGIDEFELDDFRGDGVLFQIPVSQLDNILSSFSTSFSTPIEITFQTINDYELHAHVAEEIEFDGDVETKINTFVIKTTPVRKNVLNNLSVLRSADDLSQFEYMDETTLAYAQILTTDLLPYVPDKVTKGAVVTFHEKNTSVFSNTYLINYVNNISSVIKTGGYGYHALSIMREMLSNNEDIRYFLDEELSSLVLNFGSTSVAVRYDNNPLKPENLLEKVDLTNFVQVPRAILESHINRIKLTSSNAVTQQVSFEISEDLTELRVSTADYDSSVRITESKSAEVDSLDNGVSGFTFNLPLSGISNAFFGKGDGYSDDFRIHIAPLQGVVYVAFKDTTNAWAFLTKMV